MSTFTQQQDPNPKFNKCNTCFNLIVWDDALAQSIYNNRKPFVLDKTAQHTCPRDGQGNVIKVQGYVLQGKKVVWVGVDANGHTIGTATNVPAAISSPFMATGTAASSAAAAGTQQQQGGQGQQQGQQQQNEDISNAFGEQLNKIIATVWEISNRLLNVEQSQKRQQETIGNDIQGIRNDMQEMKTVIINYIQYNPTEKGFNRMMDTMMKYLPEPELKPVTADRLLEEGKENNKQDQEEELNLEEQ